MKIVVLAVSFLLLAVHPACFASADETWEVIVPTLQRGAATEIQMLPNGDMLVSGSAALSTPTLAGAWITRMTPKGEFVWTHEFLGDAHSSVSSLLVDGEQVLLGISHMVSNPTQADSSGFAAAISLDGEILWETSLAEPRASISGTELQKLSNGDLLAKSVISSRDESTRAAHYTRLSATGKIIWSYTATPTGEYYDSLPPARSGARDKSGKPIYLESPGPVGEEADGNLHMYIYRSGFIPGESTIGRCEVATKSGFLVDAAICESPKDTQKAKTSALTPYKVSPVAPGLVLAKSIEVSKVSETGTVAWTWTYETDYRAGLTDAVLTSDGGIIGVGFLILEAGQKYHRYDAVIFRLGKDGNEMWSHVYKSEKRDIFAKIAAADNGDFLVVGHTGAKASTAWWDPWIVRVGPAGVFESAAKRE